MVLVATAERRAITLKPSTPPSPSSPSAAKPPTPCFAAAKGPSVTIYPKHFTGVVKQVTALRTRS